MDEADSLRPIINGYIHENFYFGDWIPLRNTTKRIVGFKVVPFANDDYLERRILSAKFIKLASNVSIERVEKYTYISIFLAPDKNFTTDTAQFIEAAIFHNQNDNFIIRLDGFREQDWGQFGFTLTEWNSI